MTHFFVTPYQEALITPGISPFNDNSLKHNLHNPNFLKTARGLPHNLHRVRCRTLNFLGFPAFAIVDFFATTFLLLSKL